MKNVRSVTTAPGTARRAAPRARVNLHALEYRVYPWATGGMRDWAIRQSTMDILRHATARLSNHSNDLLQAAGIDLMTAAPMELARLLESPETFFNRTHFSDVDDARWTEGITDLAELIRDYREYVATGYAAYDAQRAAHVDHPLFKTHFNGVPPSYVSVYRYHPTDKLDAIAREGLQLRPFEDWVNAVYPCTPDHPCAQDERTIRQRCNQLLVETQGVTQRAQPRHVLAAPSIHNRYGDRWWYPDRTLLEIKVDPADLWVHESEDIASIATNLSSGLVDNARGFARSYYEGAYRFADFVAYALAQSPYATLGCGRELCLPNNIPLSHMRVIPSP